jgi:hypothetical protein
MGLMELLQPKIDAAREARSVLDEFKTADLNTTTPEDWAKIAAAREAASPFYLFSKQVGYKDGLPVYTDDGLGNGGAFGWHYELSPNGELVKDYAEPSNNSGAGRITQGIMTGGLSEVAGDKFNKYALPFLNPGAVSAKGVADSLKSGDWASALQYAADPITEPGIDVLARKSGEEIYKQFPEIKPYVKPVATTIASLYAPWAGLAAYELTNKMEGGSAEQGVLGGAAMGATYGLQSGMNSYVPGLDSIPGRIVTGAVTGAVSSAPQAIKEDSWKPVVRGALTGAVVGGIGGTAHELSDLYGYGESLGKAGSTAYDGGSMSYDGGVNYVPVGAGSFADSAENPTTLNQLMTELETPSGGGMSLANDPIPTESNPIGTPEFSATQLPDTDTSSMNITESFQYAEPAYKTAKTAYNLYNVGKGVYNNYQNYQDAKDQTQQPITQPIQPVQTPITAPVGTGYTLGNMPIGEDERRAWGRVLV